MRWESKRKDKHEWHWWFAWRPIRLQVSVEWIEETRSYNRVRCWLWWEHVRRCKDLYGSWHYELTPEGEYNVS